MKQIILFVKLIAISIPLKLYYSAEEQFIITVYITYYLYAMAFKV